MLGYCLVVLVVYLIFANLIEAWETPSPHQYHIQTDEGPERYFRYQTDSGQYRKEKRLEDGTVVGTYAWIDADGILRQRDYIADNAGYRILKNKNVFVGRNINVGDAVKTAKKYPANAGTLVKTGLQHTRPVITVPYKSPTFSNNYIPTSTPSPYSIPSTTLSPYSVPSTTLSPYSIPSTTPSQLVTSTYGSSIPYISTTPGRIPSSTYAPSITSVPISNVSPYVDVSPNSIEYSGPFRIVVPSEPSIVEITPNSFLKTSYDVPLNNFSYIPGNNLQSTISPYKEVTEVPFIKKYIAPLTGSSPLYPSTVSPYSPDDFGGSQEVDHNSLEYNPYVRHVKNNYRFQNGPTYPLDKNGRTYVGYEPKAQTYDGVSVTNDGFRYYIPRAYHEEETEPGDKRSGSFGYIDPFGIRRVIYYNAAPGTGFQHRKNNRYVGFNAPPYDPRPY